MNKNSSITLSIPTKEQLNDDTYFKVIDVVNEDMFKGKKEEIYPTNIMIGGLIIRTLRIYHIKLFDNYTIFINGTSTYILVNTDKRDESIALTFNVK